MVRCFSCSVILISVLILLQGCIFKKQCSVLQTFTSEQEKQQAWIHHQQQILPVTAWQVTGRAGIRTAKKALSAGISWQQNHTRYLLMLKNPLGQPVLKLSGYPDHYVLQTSGNKPVTGSNVRQLVFDETGWEMPFDALSYWMRGIPLPEIPASTELNDQGRLAMLNQSGWKIIYSQYTCFGKYILPSRIRLIHNDFNIILSLLWDRVR